jgi:hypothetical protein
VKAKIVSKRKCLSNQLSNFLAGRPNGPSTMAEPEEGVAEASGAPEGGGQGEEVVASGEEGGEEVQEEEVPEDEIPT